MGSVYCVYCPSLRYPRMLSLSLARPSCALRKPPNVTDLICVDYVSGTGSPGGYVLLFVCRSIRPTLALIVS